jgi:hypothetical protein
MATEKDQNFYLNRVQALMSKADDPAVTEEEAQAFRDKAEELLIQYGIDRAILASHKREGAPEEIISKRFDFSKDTYPLDRIYLLFRIAIAMNCNGYTGRTRSGSRALRTQFTLFGYESDVERVEFLFAALTLHMFSEGAKAEVPYYMAKVTFLKSFYDAYSNEVHRRLKALSTRLTEKAEPGAAVAVIERGDAVKAFMNGTLKKPNQKGAPRSTHYAGEEAGRAAGKRADLNQTRVGGSRVQIGR